MDEPAGPDRRLVLRGGAAFGIAAVGLPLAGCGSSSYAATEVPGAQPVPAAPTPKPTPRRKSDLYRRGEGDVAETDPIQTRRPTSGKSAAEPPAAKAAALARADEVPVGGGKVFEEDKLVVTQPTAGQFKGFDATCTHTGCLVGEVAGGTINCFCHGSKFSIADGSVTAGPADGPLAPQSVEVSDGEIRRKK